jgi:hypothetical protein
VNIVPSAGAHKSVRSQKHIVGDNDMAKKEDALMKQEQALAKVDFGEYTGTGMENVTQADISIPFLGIVQKLSPQLDKTHEKYIEGATEGDLFNSVTNQLLGTKAYFVPCCKDSQYVEWVPRDKGGGLVGMHAPGSEFVRDIKSRATDQFKLKTDEGNDLIETHYVYGMLIAGATGKTVETPIVIGFSSSKIKVYRTQLMTPIRTIKGNPPMCAFRFEISTVPAKNKAGQPYHNFKIVPACGSMAQSANLPGTDYEGLLKEGKCLVEAVHGGTAKAAVESQTDQQTKTDGDEPF